MQAEPTNRIIRCYHCRGMMRVAARALSVFCPHCQKRVTIEGLRIVGSHPGKELSTCGDIVVEATARLQLQLTGNNIHILGKVRGAIIAAGIVEVGPTGQVIGNIKAAKILVRDGGVIQGRCDLVRPSPLPETPSPAEEVVSADESASAPKSEPESPRPSFRPMPLPPPREKTEQR